MQPLKSLVLATLAVAVCAGCGASNPTSPSADTFTGSIAVETFTSTLALGGSIFYSFTVPLTGTVSLTLVDLQEDGAPTSDTIGLQLGTPVGTGCATSAAVTASAGATPQLTVTVDPSVYCVKLIDTGGLTAPARFTLIITRPR